MAPPLPTPSGVIRARLLHGIGGSVNYGSAFEMRYSGPSPDTTALTTLAGIISTEYATWCASMLSLAYGLNEVHCSDLQTPSTPDGINSVVVPGTRAGTYPQLARSTAACLIFHVNRKYRGARPKTFLPWGVDTDLANNATWLGAFISAAEGAWLSLTGSLDGQVFGSATLTTQAAVSYIEPPYSNVPVGGSGRVRREGTARNPPLVQDVTSVTCQARLGSQRRRLGSP